MPVCTRLHTSSALRRSRAGGCDPFRPLLQLTRLWINFFFVWLQLVRDSLVCILLLCRIHQLADDPLGLVRRKGWHGHRLNESA